MARTQVPEEGQRVEKVTGSGDTLKNIKPRPKAVIRTEGYDLSNDGLANLYWWDPSGNPSNADETTIIKSNVSGYQNGEANEGVWRRMFTPSTELPDGSSGAVQYTDGNGNFVGNASYLYVDNSNGRVGIGTDSPSTQLDVQGGVSIQDFTFDQSSGDLVLTDDSGVELIRQPKAGPTEFIQGISLGTIEAPEDSLTQVVNVSSTAAASSGDPVGYTFAVDNQSLLEVSAEADGSGGIQNASVDFNSSISGLDTDDIPEGSNEYFTDERAQDAVGTIITGSGATTVNYDDANDTITVSSTNTTYSAGDGLSLNNGSFNVRLNVFEDGGTAFTNSAYEFDFTGNLTASGSNRVTVGLDQGDGSGLDADTLDGVEGNNYARTDIAETFNDEVYFTGGNVGIGTSSPTSSLYVNNGDVTFDRSDNSNQPGFAYSESDGKTVLGRDTSSSFDKTRLTVFKDGTGIVTTRNPSDSTIALSGYFPSVNFNALRDSTSTTYSTGGAAFRIQQNLGSGELNFETAPTASDGDTISSWDTRLTITEGGNVGIGTSSPSYKLDVDGVILSGTGEGVSIGSSGVPSAHSIVGTGGRLTISTENGSTDTLEISSNDVNVKSGSFYVNSSGDVGINTTSPSYRLDVNGDINAQGTLRSSGNVVSPDSDSDAHHTRPSAGDGLEDSSNTFNVRLDVFEGGGTAFTNSAYQFDFTGNLTASGTSRVTVGLDQGSGSGLNADLLDGVEGSNYARTDVAETFNANISLNGNDINNVGTITSISTSFGELVIDDFTFDQDSDDLVLSDNNGVELIRQPKGGSTQFVQGAEIGSIEAPGDSFTQIVNAPSTSAASSGDLVGYTFAVDNQSLFEIRAESDGVGGIQNGQVHFNRNLRIGSNKAYFTPNLALSEASTDGNLKIGDGSGGYAEVEAQDYYVNEDNVWLGDHIGDSDAHHTRPSAGDGLSDNSNTFNVGLNVFEGGGTAFTSSAYEFDFTGNLTTSGTNRVSVGISQGSGSGLDADTLDGVELANIDFSDIAATRYTDEEAQDAVGTITSGGSDINVNYDDANDSLTISHSVNGASSDSTSDTFVETISVNGNGHVTSITTSAVDSTSSQTLLLDSSSANSVLLKSVADELQIRNQGDSAYRDLRVRDLVVEGTETIINTETIEVSDNKILLNSNVSGSPTEDAGIEVERGDSTNARLFWNESSDYWMAGLSGSEVQLANVNENLSTFNNDLNTNDIDEPSSPSSSDNLYFTDERAQDAVGTIMTGSGATTVTYDDANDTITISSSDSDTTYSAGDGLALNNGTFDVRLNVFEGGGTAFSNSAYEFDFTSNLEASGTNRVSVEAVASGNTGAVQYAGSGGGFVANDNYLYIDDSNGNVGIGTTSPSAILEIEKGSATNFRFGEGASDATPSIAVRNVDGGKAAALVAGLNGGAFVFDDSGNFTIQADSRSNIDNDSAGAGTNIVRIDGGATSDSLRINSSGDVGIGISSPDYKLDVDGGISVPESSYYRAENSSGTNSRLLGVAGSDVYLGAVDDLGGKVNIREDGTTVIQLDNGNVVFQNDANLSNVNDATINGILTVNGGQATISSDSGLAELSLEGGDTGDVDWRLISGYPNAGDFTIREATNANRFTIEKNTGNVGIGTSSPSYKLDVNGDINAQSTLRSGGSVVSPDSDSDAHHTRPSAGDGLSDNSNTFDVRLNVFEGGGTAFTNSAYEFDFTGNLTASGTNRISVGIDQGSGSGLDADTLDGIEGSNYARTDIAETFNDEVYFTGGNVGVNTSSPHFDLEVISDVSIGSGNNSGTSHLYFDHKSTEQTETKAAIISEAAGNWGQTTGIRFAINNVSDNTIVSASDTKMIVDPSGNVGIGTTSPGYKLDVTGTVHASRLNLENEESADNDGDIIRDNSVGFIGRWGGNAQAVLWDAQNVSTGSSLTVNGGTGNEGQPTITHATGSNGTSKFTSGSTVIDDIDIDGDGHVTNINTESRSLDDWNAANADLNIGNNNLDNVNTLNVRTVTSNNGDAHIDWTQPVHFNNSGGNNESYVTRFSKNGASKPAILTEDIQIDDFTFDQDSGDLVLTDDSGVELIRQPKAGPTEFIQGISLGAIEASEDSYTQIINAASTSAASTGDLVGYTLSIDNQAVLEVKADADGSGGITNKRVGFPSDVTFGGAGQGLESNNGQLDVRLPIQDSGGATVTTAFSFNFGRNLDVTSSGGNQVTVDATASGNTGAVQYASSSGYLAGNAGYLYVDDSNGNVGIGTSSPSDRLTIADSDGNEIFEFNTGTEVLSINTDGFGGGLSLDPDPGTNQSTISSGARLNLLSNNGGNPGVIRLHNNGVYVGSKNDAVNVLDVEGNVAVGSSYAGNNNAPSNGAIIEGNVGIGLTSPSSKLQVGGNVNVGYGGENQDRSITLHSSDSNGKKGIIKQVGGSLRFTYSVANQGLYLGDSSDIWDSIRYYGDFHSFLDESGSEVVRIDSSGSVGIGTSSPSETLEVVGGLRVSDGNNDGFVEYDTASEQVVIHAGGAGNTVPFKIEDDVSDTALSMDRNGTLYVQREIGIGTTSPSYALDVNGDINAQNTLRSGGNVVSPDSNSNAHHTRPSAGDGLSDNSNTFNVRLNVFEGGGTAFTNSAYEFDFTGNLTASGSNRVTVGLDQGDGSGLDADTLDGVEGNNYARTDIAETFNDEVYFTGGNVGIGTSSPQTELDVQGIVTSGDRSAGTSPGWIGYNNTKGFFAGSGSDNAFFGLRNRDGSSGSSNAYNAVIYWGDDPDDDLEFVTQDNGETGRFTGDGKFGIGTSSPSYTLDVAGNAGVNNDINLSVGSGRHALSFSSGGINDIRFPQGQRLLIQADRNNSRVEFFTNASGGEVRIDSNRATSSSIDENSGRLNLSASYYDGSSSQSVSGVIQHVINGSGNSSLDMRVDGLDVMQVRKSGDVYIPNGDVGIGTAYPGNKLDVNGDINAQGTLRSSGNVVSPDSNSNAHHTRPSAGDGLSDNSNAFNVRLDVFKSGGTAISNSVYQFDFTGNLTASGSNRISVGIDQGSGSGLDADTLDGVELANIEFSDIAATRYTDEEAQDAVGTIMSGGTDITVTYDDGANSITVDHANTGAADSSNSGSTVLQSLSTDGRGHVDSISTTTFFAGSGLSLSGTTFEHSDTSSQGNVSTGGSTIIDDIQLDDFGHIDNINTENRSLDDWQAANADIDFGTNDILNFSGGFDFIEESGDLVLQDSNGVNLIRQPEGGSTQFIQGAEIGSIETPADALTQVINAASTSAAASGDVVGYTFAVDNQSILEVKADADGSGGITNKRVSFPSDVEFSGAGDGLVSNNGQLDVRLPIDNNNSNVTTAYAFNFGTDINVTDDGGNQVTVEHANTGAADSSNTLPTVIRSVSTDGRGHVTSLSTGTFSGGTDINVSGGTIDHANTGSDQSTGNSNGTLIQDVNTDGRGHVTAVGTQTLSAGDGLSLNGYTFNARLNVFDSGGVAISNSAYEFDFGSNLSASGSSRVSVSVEQGSGSGLNADLLDGNEASAFAKADESNTSYRFNQNVAAGDIQPLARFNRNEGTVALMIQVQSKTGGNSGTNNCIFQGGYSVLGSGWQLLEPFAEGRGHGDSTEGFDVYIKENNGYSYDVAVGANNSNKSLAVNITVLGVPDTSQGPEFVDLSGNSAITTSGTGTIYSHTNLYVGNQIGVGTNSPSYDIDVSGTIRATSDVRAGSNVRAGTAFVTDGVVEDTSGTTRFNVGSNQTTVSDENGDVVFRANSSNVNQIYDNGGDIYIGNDGDLTVQPNGYVGINTNTPSYYLDVVGTVHTNRLNLENEEDANNDGDLIRDNSVGFIGKWGGNTQAVLWDAQNVSTGGSLTVNGGTGNEGQPTITHSTGSNGSSKSTSGATVIDDISINSDGHVTNMNVEDRSLDDWNTANNDINLGGNNINNVGTITSTSTDFGELQIDDFTFGQDSGDLVLSDDSSIELIRQPKAGPTEFVQGISIGSIEAPEDSFTQILNASSTSAATSGDIVGYTLSIDNQSVLEVKADADGSGGITNKRVDFPSDVEFAGAGDGLASNNGNLDVRLPIFDSGGTAITNAYSFNFGTDINVVDDGGNQVTVEHANTGSDQSTGNSGQTFLQNISTDGRGHVDSVSTNTINVDNYQYWIISDGSASTSNVNSTETVNIQSGSNLSTSLSGNDVTVSHSTGSNGTSKTTGGATVIDDISIDSDGHVTNMNVENRTVDQWDAAEGTVEMNEHDIYFQPASSGGSVTAMTLESNGNSGSDYGYIEYHDDYFGDGSGEQAALVLRSENDGGTGSGPDSVVLDGAGGTYVERGSLRVENDITEANNGGETEGDVIWDSSNSHIPQGRLENDSITVAGNNVALGGSTGISHSNLDGIGSSDHHTRPSAGDGIQDNSNTFNVRLDVFEGGGTAISNNVYQFDFTGNLTASANSNRVTVGIDEGGGSGLNADTVDGYEASEFAALAENETISGTWTFDDTLAFPDNATGRIKYDESLNGNRLYFQRDSSAAETAITLEGTNVGIGDAFSPSYAVDVIGDVNVSGAVRANGNLLDWGDLGISQSDIDSGDVNASLDEWDAANNDINIGGNDINNVRRINGSNGNHRIRFDSNNSWVEFTDQSNNRRQIVTQDTYINEINEWLGTSSNLIDINAGGGLSGGGSTGLTDQMTISHSDTSSQGNVSTGGATVIDDIGVDGYGHVTNMNTQNRSLDDWNTANSDIDLGGNNIDNVGNLNVSSIDSNNGGNPVQVNQGLDMNSNAVTFGNFDVEYNSNSESLDFIYKG